MRISWLSAEEIAAAREALTAGGASWDDHFGPDCASAGVREQGLAAARARFAGSGVAIEAATLAAAAHEDDALDLDQVIGVLRCAIDSYVFYAPFLTLLIQLAANERELAVKT